MVTTALPFGHYCLEKKPSEQKQNFKEVRIKTGSILLSQLKFLGTTKRKFPLGEIEKQEVKTWQKYNLPVADKKTVGICFG